MNSTIKGLEAIKRDLEESNKHRGPEKLGALRKIFSDLAAFENQLVKNPSFENQLVKNPSFGTWQDVDLLRELIKETTSRIGRLE